ncbi:MAG: hypothetical protein ACJ74Y_15155 [Bryobacteraceae bacterium]
MYEYRTVAGGVSAPFDNMVSSSLDDKLIQIGFETADARKLRDYLAGKGVSVPSRVSKDSDGNYSFPHRHRRSHSLVVEQALAGMLTEGDLIFESMAQ